MASRVTSESCEGESALIATPFDQDVASRDRRRARLVDANPYAFGVDRSPIERFDMVVDELFDVLRGRPFVDRLMYSVTEVADFSVLWHLLGVSQGLVRADGFERAA